MAWSKVISNSPVDVFPNSGEFTYGGKLCADGTFTNCDIDVNYNYEFKLDWFSEYEGNADIGKVGQSRTCNQEMFVSWFNSSDGSGLSGPKRTLTNRGSSDSNFVIKNVDDCRYIVTKSGNSFSFVIDTNFLTNSYVDSGYPIINVPTSNKYSSGPHNGHKVKYLVTGYTIPSNCISNNDKLVELYFPHSEHDDDDTHVVKTISSNAFSDNQNLSAITFGNSVETIGEGAFSGCSGLIHVDWAHSGCESSTNIRTIKERAFANCTKLEKLYCGRGDDTTWLPSTIEVIGNYAFTNCSSLTAITIGSTIEVIGNYAFSDCSSLNDIKIYRGLNGYLIQPLEIGENAFSGVSTSGILHVPSRYLSDWQNWASVNLSGWDVEGF